MLPKVPAISEVIVAFNELYLVPFDKAQLIWTASFKVI